MQRGIRYIDGMRSRVTEFTMTKYKATRKLSIFISHFLSTENWATLTFPCYGQIMLLFNF